MEHALSAPSASDRSSHPDPASLPSRTARHDIYAPIHMALRAALTDAMLAVGRLDAADIRETTDVVARVRDLLDLCQQHLETENALIHPAMEARRPGSTRGVAAEHVGHAASIAHLRRQVEALARAPAGAREPVAVDLYRCVALFVGENLVHMHAEESAHNAVLWDAYSDDELLALEATIKAHVPPAAMRQALRWMVPAMTPAQRAGMFVEMRARAPVDAYEGAIALARAHLDARAIRKLDAALAD